MSINNKKASISFRVLALPSPIGRCCALLGFALPIYSLKLIITAWALPCKSRHKMPLDTYPRKVFSPFNASNTYCLLNLLPSITRNCVL